MEIGEAERLVDLVERPDRQVGTARGLCDGHCIIGRHARCCLAVGEIDPRRQFGDFLVASDCHADRAAYRRSGRFPGGPRQQALARVGIAKRTNGKDVSATDGTAQPVERTKPVTGQIECTVIGLQLTTPALGDERGRCRPTALFTLVNSAQVIDRVEQRLPAGAAARSSAASIFGR